MVFLDIDEYWVQDVLGLLAHGVPMPTAVRCLPFASLLPVLAISLAFPVSAPAEPIRHPLVSQSARQAVEELRAAGVPDELMLRFVDYAESAWQDSEGGQEHRNSGVSVDWDSVSRWKQLAVPSEGESSPEFARFVDPRLFDPADDVVDGVVDLEVVVANPSHHQPTYMERANSAMLLGHVSTSEELAEVRLQWLQDKVDSFQASLDEIALEASRLGGWEDSRNPYSGVIVVSIPGDRVAEFVDLGLGDQLAPLSNSISNAVGQTMIVNAGNLNGAELEDILQTDQFYRDGYYGQVGSEYLGVIGNDDQNPVWVGHPGFQSNLGVTRVTNCMQGSPGDNFCTVPSAAASEGTPSTDGNCTVAHSNCTVGVLAGDLTRGQDASIGGTQARLEGSGVARRAKVRHFDGVSHAFASARVIQLGPPLVVNNMGYGTPLDPEQQECRGNAAPAVNFNAMYEAGVPVFASAGNEGHSNSSWCTTSGSANAMGSFVVGAAIADDPSPPLVEMVTYQNQSRGGTSSEGRGRTIIDITGPSDFDELGYSSSDDNGILYDMPFGATSSAVPTVGGAAAVFRDWYRGNISSAIDEPGLMYVNMLLMGDRQEEDGTPETAAGFSNIWGAGLLHARKFDEFGMDEPWRWYATSRCIDDGEDETVGLTSNGTAVPWDAQPLKAAIWFYDTEHDAPANIFGNLHQQDDITLRLQRRNSNGTWTTIRTDASDDNKKRVLYWDLSADRHRLVISGVDVTSDNQVGCGTNSMRVYIAFFYEDSDRESGENMNDIRVEF